MPVPIRPVNDFTVYKEEKPDSSSFLIDPNMLSGAFAQPSAKLGSSIIATASDDEASVLFDLWQKCDVIEDGDRPETKRYAVPDGFPEDTVIRLKAANLLAGDNKTVRFTSRAVAVIATMSLAEDNVFEKAAVKKPYSQILAESKMPKRHSRLALASSNNTSLVKTATTVLAQRKIPNVTLPWDRMPTHDTEYISSQRMTYQRGNSNKQYVVRIYQYEDGYYGVIGWNGKIGGRLTPHGKYFGRSRNTADMIYAAVISEKMNRGSESYSLAPETSGIPGRQVGRETPTRSDPTSTRPATPSRSVPREVPETKVTPEMKEDPRKEDDFNIEQLLNDTNAEEMFYDDDDDTFA